MLFSVIDTVTPTFHRISDHEVRIIHKRGCPRLIECTITSDINLPTSKWNRNFT